MIAVNINVERKLSLDKARQHEIVEETWSAGTVANEIGFPSNSL
jgi:hypothetical protein